MKIKTKYILLCAAALLASCQERLEPTYSVGADDNAIVLRAGISEGGASVQTRAGANPDANHSSHLKFTRGTALTLRVDGVWKEKADGAVPHGTITSTVVSLKTNATIGDDITVNSEGSATHNKVTFTPAQQLYWDDYGSADPANMSTGKGGTVEDGTDGRGRGLDIFAVAVNAVTTAPEVSSWTALPWSVEANQTGGWSAKDLLTSNNVKKTDDVNTTNPYKFDDRASGKLLEFTHAMTKVTVELTAGAGFADAKFVDKPKVTLLQFNYTGTVNVEAKTSTATTDTKTDIKAHLAEVMTTSGGTWSEAPATWASSNKAKYDALVFPGNQFTATIATEEPHTPTSTDEILEIDADGNIYTVTAAQLVKAIAGISVTGTPVNGTLEQAKNYILKITVNKTGINKIDATIKDWVEVSAENEAPVINITQAYGYDGTAFCTDKSFSFLRSTTKNASYSKDAQMNYVKSPESCTLTPVLYWPDHDTHFFFRATWPVIAESGTTGEYIPSTNFTDANAITVVNEKFNAGHYPSEMMLGYPRVSAANGVADETCKAGHKQADGTTPVAGICATEGNINMDFRYAMSQVIVELKTNEEVNATNKVTFDADTKVEIIGGYTSGKLMLADGTSDFSGKNIAEYVMNNKAAEDYDSFHDAIIPQALTNANGDLRFRITVKTGTTLDKYETVLGIKSIKVNGDQTITAWEPGKKYTYTLNITKTGISVTATFKDWITVTADENIWF